MRHETHIPAQQTQAEKNVWVPSPHEDSRRPKSDQAPQSSRSQKAGRLKFSKELRLKRRQDFLRLQKKGQRIVGKCLCVDYQLTGTPFPKLGITASSRYGNAPERSRFKRLVREAFRKSLSFLPPSIELNVLPRQKAKGVSAETVRDELLHLIQTIKAEDHAQS